MLLSMSFLSLSLCMHPMHSHHFQAVNIKANLPLWVGIVDYFVFLIDKRTTDSSKEDIARILDHPVVKGYKILDYDFLAQNSHKNLSGFGGARTLSLEKAYEYFPQATHVWIADPGMYLHMRVFMPDEYARSSLHVFFALSIHKC